MEAHKDMRRSQANLISSSLEGALFAWKKLAPCTTSFVEAITSMTWSKDTDLEWKILSGVLHNDDDHWWIEPK